MKHPLPLALLILGLLACPAAAQEAAPPQPVVSEIVTGEAAHLRSFPGIVAARVEAPLAFQTSGRVQTRPASVGAIVKRNDVLATLDQITLAEDVSAAEAAVSSAQAQADFANQSLSRAQELRRREVASEALLEAARAQADAAEAALQAAQADLARAEDAARFGTLRAPTDGVVISTLVEPGTTVAAGTPVLVLATQDGRDVVIDVPQDVLAVVTPQTRFLIWPRMSSAAPVRGRLRLIEPVADSGARSHRLRIAIDSSAKAPRLGALVDVRLDMPVEAALSVPRAAILDTDDGPQVWRVGPDRKAEAVPVAIAPGPGERVVVTHGLNVGDEILIRGIHSVEPGQQLGDRIE